MASAVDWLLNNIGRSTWWRSLACQQYPKDCALEGGVDVPLSGGTPIYALGTGKLMGAGYFCHGGPWFNTSIDCSSSGSGNPGYGVVTQDIPGVGQVYYQHIDIAPGIPFCESGNCNNVTVQAGQLIGYSKNPPGEVEVGINSTWGGIWGTNTNSSAWVSDPRAALTALASGNSTITPLTNTTGNSSLNPFQPVIDFFSGAGNWLNHPVRVLKLLFGVSGLILSLVIIFWPEIKQTVSTATNIAKTAALA